MCLGNSIYPEDPRLYTSQRAPALLSWPPLAPCGSERVQETENLDAVADVGGGGVALDVGDVLRSHAGLAHRLPHCGRLRRRRRRRETSLASPPVVSHPRAVVAVEGVT